MKYIFIKSKKNGVSNEYIFSKFKIHCAGPKFRSYKNKIIKAFKIKKVLIFEFLLCF